MRSTIGAALLVFGCAGVTQSAAAQQMTKPTAPTAYLPPSELPDPRTYLPDPPAPGTPAEAADRAAYAAALAGKGGAAWNQATAQVRLRSPAVERGLMCAVGARLDPTPVSAYGRLLARATVTLSEASEAAKTIWKRDRPFVGDSAPVVCDPGALAAAPSPSYPGGHAGIGWLWGLMLSELAPDRSGELLRWGAALGDNRVACRVHYPSDIAAGRMLGAALYARLQSVPAFRADMAEARAEIAAARAAGPPADCD